MEEGPGSSADVGNRTTLVQIQPSRLRRKGKPIGDGTRPEPGRATSLEGSTPSPSADRTETRVGRALASPSDCNPPAPAVQVQLLPDTLHGLVAQSAEQDSLKVEVQGSTPCGATGSILGVSSNGKTVGLHPANEGSIPSTVH